MAAGVGLTGVAAFLTYQFTGPELLQSPLMWVLMLAPLGLVFFISARINNLSVEAARGLFFLYAALVGISLSTIFHIYTESSITRVFFISAAAFGALSIWGYTTQRNLSGFRTFLFMTNPNISTNNWLSSGCPSLYGRYIIGRESPYTANEKAADGACWAIAVHGKKAGNSAKVESRTRRLIPKREKIGFIPLSLELLNDAAGYSKT